RARGDEDGDAARLSLRGDRARGPRRRGRPRRGRPDSRGAGRMKVVRLEDAAAFLAEANELLLSDEARHNLILGIAGTVRDAPQLYPLRSFWLARYGDEVVVAALRTPPYNLVLARPRSPHALAALAEAVAGEELPGVVGAEPEAEEFAELWTAHTGASARTN